MKIYSVTILQPGNKVTRHLWQQYQSATQSFSRFEKKHGEGNVLLEAVHVPEDEWKEVDRTTETRLNRVAVLWEQLVATDPDDLDALLGDLVRQLQPRAATLKPDAMAALDRLVDAQ